MTNIKLRGKNCKRLNTDALVRENLTLAQMTYRDRLDRRLLAQIRKMTQQFRVSLLMGDCLLLNNSWYITNSGLLGIALRRRCIAIDSAPILESCDANARRWIFRATVQKWKGSKGFVGYGDADPSNVSPLVRGAEMRVAETRAVNRALRKAYGIGLCSVEELGCSPRCEDSSHESKPTNNGNGNGNGKGVHATCQPRLRDRLCLLIRQHRLDPNLVKSYAADFCGTPVLRDASRERLEEFVNHLSQQATTDRDALVCQLNSFNSSQEVQA